LRWSVSCAPSAAHDLEFVTTLLDPADVESRAITLAGSRDNVPVAILRLARRHPMPERVRPPGCRHHQYVGIEIPAHFPAGPEALASPTTPSSVVELCWLSGTMRTYVERRGLGDIAEERTLSRLDVPRPLAADIDATARRVGAPAILTSV
jgi:hypothetical protein